MNELSETQRHALLRILKKALVRIRTFTGVSTRHDHDGGVTPEMWKAANAALNAVHNMPDWLENSPSMPFDEEFFVKSLRHIDHLFESAGQKTDFLETWREASVREKERENSRQ